MVMVSTTVTVNAAFLQEIKQDNIELHRLLQEVDHFCCGKEFPTGKQQFSELLGRLRDQLAMHFSLEEAYGYFDDSISGDSGLSKRADELRGEHGCLFSRLNELVETSLRLLDRHSPRSVCRHVAERFQEFHADLQTHEQKENDLILDALEQDLGCGD